MYRKFIPGAPEFSFKYPDTQISDKEAKPYFAGLMKTIPFAIQWLREYISASSDITAEQLDYSPESLKLVWKWYIQRVQVVPYVPELSSFSCDKRIPAQMAESLQQAILSLAPKKDLSGEGPETLVAISLYFAQTLIHTHDCLHWEIRKQKDRLYNRPVIAGFVGMYNPKFRPVYDPWEECGGVANRIATGIHSVDDLYNRYTFLAADIPV